MKLRMDKTLKFEVDCQYQAMKNSGYPGRRHDLRASILAQFERCGDAMRACGADGKIAWKATPKLPEFLAESEQEVQDDFEDIEL